MLGEPRRYKRPWAGTNRGHALSLHNSMNETARHTFGCLSSIPRRRGYLNDDKHSQKDEEIPRELLRYARLNSICYIYIRTRSVRLLSRVRIYSVEVCRRRTTDARARNPIPNKTRAADSSIFGDCVICDNCSLPNRITAKAGRARIAEITARKEPTYSILDQNLLAKIVSFGDVPAGCALPDRPP
jgi:hypothetical protein